jgi:hypothetical protein
MHKYIFTDTNLFEQFQPITDIDWLSLAGCDCATLLVPSVTIRELNEHKDGATRGRLKRRAAAALVQLRKYADQSAPVKIRDGVFLEFRENEPLIEFGSYHLDPQLNDDRLLASALALALEKGLGRDSVLVTTGDFGLELKAKSQQLIAPLALPETYRLSPELDEEEKQIRELKCRLQRLEKAAPDLTLSFEGGSRFTKISISSLQSDQEREPKEVLQRERSRRPFLQHTTPSPIMGWKFSSSQPEDIDKYNESLDTYFKKLEEWLVMERASKEWQLLTGELQFQLSNRGGAPGAGIHIDVHFPDGFIVLGRTDLPKIPEKPRAPVPPDQRLLETFDTLRASLHALDFKTPDLRVARPVNARLSSIKKTNSYRVRFEMQQLKHTLTESLPSVCIHFPSIEEVAGFGVEYEIVASNYPEPFKGNLDIEVVKG